MTAPIKLSRLETSLHTPVGTRYQNHFKPDTNGRGSLKQAFSPPIMSVNSQMGDSSSLIIENALAFWWTLMPPSAISIGKMSVSMFCLRILATQT